MEICVKCTVCQPAGQACGVLCHSRAASGSSTHTILPCWLYKFNCVNIIVMWYAIKGPLPPYQTVYGAFVTGCKYLLINTAVKTDLSVRGIWPGTCRKSQQGNRANWALVKKKCHCKFFTVQHLMVTGADILQLSSVRVLSQFPRQGSPDCPL